MGFLNNIWFALALFLLTYVLMIGLPKWRYLVALSSALLFVIFGILPIRKVFFEINWNVIMMIAGTMGLVHLFIESQMPSLMADKIIDKTSTEKWAIIALSLFAGVISAFVDNVATVLMVAPLALTISKKLGTSPVKSIIVISIASNLEGAATLVGDTTSIMLGAQANMNFLDFFWYKGRPGLFFIVQIGLILATLVLVFMFRKNTTKISLETSTKVTNFVPTIGLLGMLLLLIIASLVPLGFLPNWIVNNINGIICISVMIICLVYESIKDKSAKMIKDVAKNMDYQTLVLLASLFVIIGGIKEAGLIDQIAKLFYKFGGSSIFLMYTLILWTSVLISVFIDNIPYVATMLPVVASLAGIMNVNPTVLYFGLLCGATLGGNITPIGASANIAGLGILRKNGYEVKNIEFMKLSIPYTLVAVTSSYILVWLLFGLRL